MRRSLTGFAAAVGLIASGALAQAASPQHKVLTTYADIAHAMYEDSLLGADLLQAAVGDLVEAPSAGALIRARAAWLNARVAYQQTEGYRFGNAYVDDWEGKVNAWPLDEGLIDYVAVSYGDESDENLFYTANVIANPTLTFGGETVDAAAITPALLSDVLHEVDGIEANVATGYHAIEFLLWGQDLNGTEAGAGNRPHTDFDPANCTNGHCKRRAAYLTVATDLLIDDLKDIIAAWRPGGEARTALMADEPKGVATILTGLGSLSYGELAGERIKLGLMLHDPEEEHDCFADNTHNSHYYNQIGMIGIYTGSYTRIDGSSIAGPSVAELIARKDAAADKAVRTAMAETLARMQVMKDMADRRIMSYDQMIASGNAEGNAVIQNVVDGLVAQARAIEGGVAALGLSGIEFEGSDSLDDPDAVFQ